MMCDQEQRISRALDNGDFLDALYLMGLGGHNSLRFASHGPPGIPAFSTKKSRSQAVPPSRPKIYGPPPYPAFQRRNSQSKEPDGLKDPEMFVNFPGMSPRSESSEQMSNFLVIEPSRFFPSLMVDRSSSTFVPSQETFKGTTSDDDDDDVIASGRDTPTLSEEEDGECPFCARENTTDENKQFVIEVLKAVNSESSKHCCRYTERSPKEVYSESDVQQPAAILSTSQQSDVSEDKHLSLMFSTDTFQDSSASSTQELGQDSATGLPTSRHRMSDTGLATMCAGPMSDTGLPNTCSPMSGTGLPNMCGPMSDTGLPSTCNPMSDTGLTHMCGPMSDTGLPNSCDQMSDIGLSYSCDMASDTGLPTSCDLMSDTGLPNTCDEMSDTGLPSTWGTMSDTGLPRNCYQIRTLS